MATSLEIVIAGRWLSLSTQYGIDEMSTVWPGGSDQVSWTPQTNPALRFTGGEQVDVYYGGDCVWSGNLSEPDASQEQLTAVGAWYLAQKYVALDGSGDATAEPDTAIDQGIVRGLTWTRPVSIDSSDVAIDISQGPVLLSTLLDTFADANNVRWGVTANRQVSAIGDDTVPTYQTLPMAGGLGYALDNYASTLIGRHLNLSGVFVTSVVTDTAAEALHGHAEDVIDMTPLGEISGVTASAILTNILAKGRSTPQWTEPIILSYGDILNMGGNPVALETVAAGRLLRVRGSYELSQRRNGHAFVDVPMGRTSLAGGVLTVTPAQTTVRTIADLAQAAVSRKSA